MGSSFLLLARVLPQHADTLATHHVFRDAKFEMTKPVSSALQVTHRFVLGEQPSCSFSTLLMGAKVRACPPGKAQTRHGSCTLPRGRPALPAQGFAMAETDTAFNVSSRGQYLVTPGWTAKAQAQVRSAAPA